MVAQVRDHGMTDIKEFFRRLAVATLKLTMGLIMAIVAVFLLLLALVLLLVGVLWALVRGRKPVPPVFVSRFHRFTTERVWPGGSDRSRSTQTTEVVDVEVREVDDTPPRLDETGPGRRPK